MTSVQRAVSVVSEMIAIHKLEEDPVKSQELAIRSNSYFGFYGDILLPAQLWPLKRTRAKYRIRRRLRWREYFFGIFRRGRNRPHPHILFENHCIWGGYQRRLNAILPLLPKIHLVTTGRGVVFEPPQIRT